MTDTALPAAPLDRLVRCPFCGCDDVVLSEDDRGWPRFGYCPECQATGPCVDSPDQFSDIERCTRFVMNKWNHRYDGRYGITARELDEQIVAMLDLWVRHHRPDNEYMRRILDTVDRRPLTQTIGSILNQLL